MAGTPLAALVIPLFFHTSPRPVLADYSGDYIAVLGSAIAGATAIAWWVGLRCAAAGSRRPAYAFLALLLGALVSLATAEAVLRRSPSNDTFADLARFGHRRSPLLGFEAKPGHRWEQAGVRFSTDERGFRTRPAGPVDWSAPGTQIAVVGGSSAFGFGLNDDETWAHLLEQKLRAKRTDVAVVNAANQGHNSYQTFVRTYLRVLPLHPQWVVLYASRNDAGSHLLPPTGAFFSEEAAPWTTSDYLTQRYPDYNIYMKLLVVYSAHDAARRRFGGRNWYPLRNPLPAPRPPGEVIAGNAASYIRNVRTLADACRRNGTRLAVATFLFDTDRTAGPLHRSLLLHNELLRELAGEGSLQLIDLERDFAPVENKRAYFFEDAYHPNARGAEFIAGRMAVHLERLLGED
jgi:lysophospholipase L1-like esterase